MRRYLIALTICPSLLFGMLSGIASSPALASGANAAQIQAIRTLQQLETVSYKAATSFYLFSVLNRDPQQQKKMQTQLTNGDVLVQKLANGSISGKWKDLKQKLTTAKFTEEGVADNASINAIDASLSTLTQNIRTIETEQRTAGGVAVDKNAELLYDQYVLMQIMTAAYLRKSADYFGGAIVATQGPQVEIDQLANKFSAQLAQLNKHYEKNSQVGPTLKEVTTKWTFIKNSFINFNQDNVPFIVGRYNEQITDKLLAAYEQLL